VGLEGPEGVLASPLACAPLPPRAPAGEAAAVCTEGSGGDGGSSSAEAGAPSSVRELPGGASGGGGGGGACSFVGDEAVAAWVRRLAALPMEPGDGEADEEGPARAVPPPPPPLGAREDPLLAKPLLASSERGLAGGAGVARGTAQPGAFPGAAVAAAAAAALRARGGLSQSWQRAVQAAGGARRGLLWARPGAPRGGGGATDSPDSGGAESDGGGGAAAPLLCIGCGEGRHAYHIGAHSLGRGHFGEVWRAVRRRVGGAAAAGASSQGGGGKEEGDEGDAFILKRVLGSRGAAVRRSGVREGYFGALLKARAAALEATLEDTPPCASQAAEQAGCAAALEELLEGHRHIVEFEESFEVGEDVWLVFRVSRFRVWRDGGSRAAESSALAAPRRKLDGPRGGAVFARLS
jgi:hypothetical protein